MPYTPQNVLARLKEGNDRFAKGQALPHFTPEQRATAGETQRPYAVVLGCSDSRVPVETVFDVQMGELFVIRTAGHVLAQASFASMRFALQMLGVTTVVILGHDDCGAVKAALSDDIPFWLKPITDHINVAGDSLDQAIDLHVRETMQEVSDWLEDIDLDHEIAVYGGAYDVLSGRVHWI